MKPRTPTKTKFLRQSPADVLEGYDMDTICDMYMKAKYIPFHGNDTRQRDIEMLKDWVAGTPQEELSRKYDMGELNVKTRILNVVTKAKMQIKRSLC